MTARSSTKPGGGRPGPRRRLRWALRISAWSTVSPATGRRSASYVATSREPAVPDSAAASFQARLCASWTPVLAPNAPAGG